MGSIVIRDDKMCFSFCVHDLLHVCNKSICTGHQGVGLGASFCPITSWKENAKRFMLLEERPGPGLQLTVIISKGAHIKCPISNSLDNQDHNPISEINGKIKIKRRWYV